MPQYKSRIQQQLLPAYRDGSASIENLRTFQWEVLQHIVAAPDRVHFSNMILVRLVSVVEEAIVTLIMEMLSVYERELVFTKYLPESLLKEQMYAISEATKSSKPQTRTPISSDVALALTECFGRGRVLLYNKRRLASSGRNLSSTELTDLVKRVDVNNFWRKVAASWAAQIQYGTKDNAIVESRLIGQWNEIIAERNLVVHSFSGATGWDAKKVDDSALIMKIVFRETFRVLRVRLRICQ